MEDLGPASLSVPKKNQVLDLLIHEILEVGLGGIARSMVANDKEAVVNALAELGVSPGAFETASSVSSFPDDSIKSMMAKAFIATQQVHDFIQGKTLKPLSQDGADALVTLAPLLLLLRYMENVHDLGKCPQQLFSPFL